MMAITRSSMAAYALAAGLGLSGCATTGTRPQDMTVTQHEAAAAAKDIAAARRTGREPYVLTNVAAQHRAAAQALRDAESRACSNAARDDQNPSPVPLEAIAAAWKIEERGRSGHLIRGVVFAVRPQDGLKVADLQRRIDCHIARGAALGFDAGDTSSCPFAVPGATARVRPDGERLLVEITTADTWAGREVWQRAQLLVSAK